MASSISNIGKIPELRKRILFTLGMLAVYRIGIFVTLPGVNRVEMQNLISTGGTGTFLGLFSVFSGGALEQLSIFALGIMPYISASIILQLLTVVVPKLDQLNKEGEQGRKKINQYTRYGTIGLSIVQAVFLSSWLVGLGRGGGGYSAGEVVNDPGMWFHIMTVLTLTTGTAFLMWLGEQITERGIGNGISLLIFAGIVAGMPDALTQLFGRSSTGDYDLFMLLVLLLIAVGTIATICYFERAHRRIPVQYTKRMVGRKMYAGTQTHLPLKINVSGVIPPIFASSILMFPAQIANMVGTPWMQSVANALNPNDWRYNVIYVGLIVFFTFFYTAVTFNPVDVADNLKKSGGFIPGIRPGKKTAEYIDYVLTRITAAGAVYLSAVCLVPALLQNWMQVPFYFGGTGLLIVVGVALDTVQQIESHLITRNYEGFTGPKGPRIRGRVTSGRGR
ncbi:preprotein translocase subunit SecY [Haliangium ochraceum]|uniref:Protein translocase subunit SecY n=1 Tax=Haliangium ochraceum (strain DSM 14365 / JCM 11303 / SMP-2) TaxID=502025 RepID=D0LIA5_HALO1|nr:preprotein translocase subunit SecY [Haliangium ochraceum]ACY16484.1 preprotein translocase, SecY subunit [Haliangium ochraceum DSM 14365]